MIYLRFGKLFSREWYQGGQSVSSTSQENISQVPERDMSVLKGFNGPGPSPSLPMAKDPILVPWGCHALPQRHCSRDSLQLRTALPSHGPCQDRPTHIPMFQPSPCLSPQTYVAISGLCLILLPPTRPDPDPHLWADVLVWPWPGHISIEVPDALG